MSAWLFNNTMKANLSKCHFLSNLDISTKISVGSSDIENTHSQNLLGFTIDRKLNFHDHVSNLCNKASAKISVQARVFLFMLLNKNKLIMKAILMSQFGYCPLAWMNHLTYNATCKL